MFDIESRRRFAKMVKKNDSGCWVWKGHCHPKGYGVFCARGQRIYAHRYIYEYLNGKLPEGMEIDHKCEVKSCVFPDHLEAVTHGENMHRAALKGAWRGERNSNAKRTEEEVRRIKRLHLGKIPIKSIAKLLRIPERSVYAILAGECWSHVRLDESTGIRGIQGKRKRFKRLEDAVAARRK